MRLDESVLFSTCDNCQRMVVRAWPEAQIEVQLDLQPLTPAQEVVLRLLHWPMYSIRYRRADVFWVDSWCLPRALGSIGRRPIVLRMHSCYLLKWGGLS